MKTKQWLIGLIAIMGLALFSSQYNVMASGLPKAYRKTWVGKGYRFYVHHDSITVKTGHQKEYMYDFHRTKHGYYMSHGMNDTIQPEPIKLINRHTLKAGDSGTTYMYLHAKKHRHKRYRRHYYRLPSTNSSYWFKTRHVRARRSFKAYHIQDTIPEADSYLIGTRYVKKGTPLYVQHRGIEWEWTISKHHFSYRHGYPLHHTYWTANGSASKWASYRRK